MAYDTGTWLNPPPPIPGIPEDLTKNTVFILNSTQTLRWSTVYTNFTIGLRQSKDNIIYNGANIYRTIFNVPPGNGTLAGVVDIGGLNLDYSNLFWFSLDPIDDPSYVYWPVGSHLFNISAPEGVASSSKAASSSTATTSLSSLFTASTPSSSPPPPISSSSSSTSPSSPPPPPRTKAGLSKGTSAGIGVGVGLLAIVTMGLGLALWSYRRRNERGRRRRSTPPTIETRSLDHDDRNELEASSATTGTDLISPASPRVSVAQWKAGVKGSSPVEGVFVGELPG